MYGWFDALKAKPHSAHTVHTVRSHYNCTIHTLVALRCNVAFRFSAARSFCWATASARSWVEA